ncbi:MAG TPA: hypothetical protein VK437_14800, partial [Steroidobacteraceae bacterium]|nr:hypothetical protein [Steroidobacteraceae bacterium]
MCLFAVRALCSLLAACFLLPAWAGAPPAAAAHPSPPAAHPSPPAAHAPQALSADAAIAAARDRALSNAFTARPSSPRTRPVPTAHVGIRAAPRYSPVANSGAPVSVLRYRAAAPALGGPA